MDNFKIDEELDSYVKDVIHLNKVKEINQLNNFLKKNGSKPAPTLMDFEKLEENKRAKIEKTYLIPKEIMNENDEQTNTEDTTNIKEVEIRKPGTGILSLDTISDIILEYNDMMEAIDELLDILKSKVPKGSKHYDQLSYLIYSIKIIK